MALTATADSRVVDDVSRVLGLRDQFMWRASFNRPRLVYEVRAKTGNKSKTIEEISEYVRQRQSQTGLIYCLSRRDCEVVCDGIQKALPQFAGKVSYYHAELDPAEREARQNRWSRDGLKLICATLAFGMGVNKPNVRYVIHYSMPKSLANYYQEAGRCGRDGLGGQCILYFSYKDRATQEAMIRDDKNGRRDTTALESELHALRHMALYAVERATCRRKLVLDYFGETDFDAHVGCNGLCDNCRDERPFELRDFGKHASALVKLHRQITSNPAATRHGCAPNVTQKGLFDAYRGGDNAQLRKLRASDAPLFGHGKCLKKDELETVIGRLVIEDVLMERSVETSSGFPIDYVFAGSRYGDFESDAGSTFEFYVRLTAAEARRLPQAERRSVVPCSKASHTEEEWLDAGPSSRKARPVPGRCHITPGAVYRKSEACQNTTRRSAASFQTAQQCQQTDSSIEKEIEERLERWRRATSENQGVMSYQIISEEHVQAIAREKPRTVRAHR